MDTNELINERGHTHGDFDKQSRITRQLKKVLHTQGVWTQLSPGQQEALDMMTVKMGRILAGDPNYEDHWIDIAGYAELGRRMSPEQAIDAFADLQRQERVERGRKETRP